MLWSKVLPSHAVWKSKCKIDMDLNCHMWACHAMPWWMTGLNFHSHMFHDICPPWSWYHAVPQIDELTRNNYKMLKSRRDDEVVARLKRQLDEFKDYMPVLQVTTHFLSCLLVIFAVSTLCDKMTITARILYSLSKAAEWHNVDYICPPSPEGLSLRRIFCHSSTVQSSRPDMLGSLVYHVQRPCWARTSSFPSNTYQSLLNRLFLQDLCDMKTWERLTSNLICSTAQPVFIPAQQETRGLETPHSYTLCAWEWNIIHSDWCSVAADLWADFCHYHRLSSLPICGKCMLVFRYVLGIETHSGYVLHPQEVSNKALATRHWNSVFTALEQEYDENIPFCVKDLLQWVWQWLIRYSLTSDLQTWNLHIWIITQMRFVCATGNKKDLRAWNPS